MVTRIIATAALVALSACNPLATPRHPHGEPASTPPWGGGGGVGRYHPNGYEAADVHGPETALGPDDCRSCHGAELDGGTSGVDCDDCHQRDWRTDCVYCHGGTDGDTDGAPPEDIDGSSEDISFEPHRVHAQGDDHRPVPCEECHGPQPEDVLTAGHTFDDTQGRAEVVFSGIGEGAAYDGAGTCSSNYCHGTGTGRNGTVEADDPEMDCESCHPNPGDAHRRHDRDDCSDCHPSARGSNAIDVPAQHVNGDLEMVIEESGFDVTGSGSNLRCTGTCHNERHNNERW